MAVSFRVAILALAPALTAAASCASFTQHRLCEGQENPRNGEVSAISVIIDLGPDKIAHTKPACQSECLKIARGGDGCCQLSAVPSQPTMVKSCRWIPDSKALSARNYRGALFQRTHFGALCVQSSKPS